MHIPCHLPFHTNPLHTYPHHGASGGMSPSKGFMPLQLDPTPINLKELRARQSSISPQDGASTSSNIPAIKTCNGHTLFFAVSRRVSPFGHLYVLRGAQNEPSLHTDAFMSPILHNTSDTYQRHLRHQLFYCKEFRQGQHQRQWLKKNKERISFIKFIEHLEFNTSIFMQGYQAQLKKDAEKQALIEWSENYFKCRESEEMAMRGWRPEDWNNIQVAIVHEDIMAVRKMDMDRSFDSIETALPSVFDSDADESDNESFSSDEQSTDQEVEQDKGSFRSNEQFRKKEEAADHDSLSSHEESEDGEDETDNDSLSSDEDEEEDESDDVSFPSDEQMTTSQPSALVQSLFYRPGEDSDSDEEDSQEQSPSPPASLYLDSSAFCDYYSEDGKNDLTPARRRKSEFLTDLMAVRQEVFLDIEAEIETKIYEDEEYERKRKRLEAKRFFTINVVSLRLEMFSSGVIGVNHIANKLFRSRLPVGYHEVEFKGHLRQQLMDRSDDGLGNLVDSAFWQVLEKGEWERIVHMDDSFEMMGGKAYLTVKAWGDKALLKELKAVSDVASDRQHGVRYQAYTVIEEAIRNVQFR